MKKMKKFRSYSLRAAKIGKKKKVKGFTLVELIVVIAIIGVLAAVLIPTMGGKVRDSRIATANDKAAKIAEQAGIVATELETSGSYSIVGKDYGASPIPLSADDDFAVALLKALPDIKDDQVYIKFNADGAVENVVYAKDTTTNYVGAYPKQTTVADYKAKKTFSKVKSEASKTPTEPTEPAE